jgi:hypothetical protein
MFPFSYSSPKRKGGKMAAIRKMKAKVAKLKKKEAIKREYERTKKELEKLRGL